MVAFLERVARNGGAPSLIEYGLVVGAITLAGVLASTAGGYLTSVSAVLPVG